MAFDRCLPFRDGPCHCIGLLVEPQSSDLCISAGKHESGLRGRSRVVCGRAKISGGESGKNNFRNGGRLRWAGTQRTRVVAGFASQGEDGLAYQLSCLRDDPCHRDLLFVGRPAGSGEKKMNANSSPRPAGTKCLWLLAANYSVVVSETMSSLPRRQWFL